MRNSHGQSSAKASKKAIRRGTRATATATKLETTSSRSQRLTARRKQVPARAPSSASVRNAMHACLFVKLTAVRFMQNPAPDAAIMHSVAAEDATAADRTSTSAADSSQPVAIARQPTPKLNGLAACLPGSIWRHSEWAAFEQLSQHFAEEEANRSQAEAARPSASRKSKGMHRACASCARKKIKCVGGRPCHRYEHSQPLVEVSGSGGHRARKITSYSHFLARATGALLRPHRRKINCSSTTCEVVAWCFGVFCEDE